MLQTASTGLGASQLVSSAGGARPDSGSRRPARPDSGSRRPPSTEESAAKLVGEWKTRLAAVPKYEPARGAQPPVRDTMRVMPGVTLNIAPAGRAAKPVRLCGGPARVADDRMSRAEYARSHRVQRALTGAEVPGVRDAAGPLDTLD